MMRSIEPHPTDVASSPIVSRNIFSILSIGKFSGFSEQETAHMLRKQVLLMNPLDSTFRIEQNRAEVWRVLRFETGIDKISRISPQHFSRALGNQSQQALLASSIGAMGDNDARTQSLSRRLANRKLAKVQRRHRAATIVEKPRKTARRLRQLLERDQRKDLDNPAGFECIAVFAQLEQ